MSEELTKQERELLTSIHASNESPGLHPHFPMPEMPTTEIDSITPSQMRSIEAFHHKVAQRISAGLSDLLQRIVDVRLVSVESITYSQFAFSRSNPTCLITLSALPLAEPLAIDYSPTILYPILDCLLGGGRQPCAIPDRPPTEIEQRLARKVTDVVLDELHNAWEHVLAVQLAVECIDSNAQRVRMVAPGENVISLAFRTRVADQTGEITLCMPVKSIRKMVNKLTGEVGSKVSPVNDMVSPKVSVRAVLGTIEMTEEQIASLKPGDLLATELPPSSLAKIFVDGQQRFEGKPGSADGQMAVVVD